MSIAIPAVWGALRLRVKPALIIDPNAFLAVVKVIFGTPTCFNPEVHEVASHKFHARCHKRILKRQNQTSEMLGGFRAIPYINDYRFHSLRPYLYTSILRGQAKTR